MCGLGGWHGGLSWGTSFEQIKIFSSRWIRLGDRNVIFQKHDDYIAYMETLIEIWPEVKGQIEEYRKKKAGKWDQWFKWPSKKTDARACLKIAFFTHLHTRSNIDQQADNALFSKNLVSTPSALYRYHLQLPCQPFHISQRQLLLLGGQGGKKRKTVCLIFGKSRLTAIRLKKIRDRDAKTLAQLLECGKGRHILFIDHRI